MKVKVKKIACVRCGHAWTPRKEDVRRCAGCKSVYWDKEPVNKRHAERIGPREEDQGLAE